MTITQDVAKKVLEAALKFRVTNGESIAVPLDIFSFAEKLGIEVKFWNLPSLEAMYIKEPGPNILISSLRPYGRQVFNCAHEIGHHYYNHGTKVDQYIDDSGNSNFASEELLANYFASYLLMPKSLVNNAFIIRGLQTETASETDFYSIACWIGVGYSTLISHTWKSLKLISEEQANRLQKFSPKSIRKNVLGFDTQGSLIIVDHTWSGRAIDIKVGDYIKVLFRIDISNDSIKHVCDLEDGALYHAEKPGIIQCRSQVDTWSSFVRVSRQNYVGRSLFRYLEDTEDEDDGTTDN